VQKNNRISNVYLNILVSHIKRSSVDYPNILKKLSLSDYIDKPVGNNGSIDQEFFLHLLHQCEDIFSDKLFSAQAGKFIHPNDFGILGLVLMNCPTYGDAIDLAYRYQYLVNDALFRTPMKDGSVLMSRINDADFDEEFIRPYAELETSMLVHFSHFITGYFFSKVPITICFRHAPSVSLHRYENLFQTSLKFKQDFNEFVMHEIVHQTPLYGANADVHQMLMGKVDDLRNLNGDEQTFLNKVASFIQTKIIYGVPTLNECATAFEISESTLKRRLQSSGMNFQQMIDHVRFSVAKNILENERLSMEDVSCMLGFSSTSAFTRSFKRWSGVTPLRYRNSLLQ